ncbi:hypothetical protein I6A84_11950 [Frankia sp. CNm7]|uniref:ATP-grasp domain-containing protein n=1 Tax=Frankia nepalensis TaxID=1836974 RepID=A0A937RMF2_9ACTN|nr:hypothetical protein [Frankia nepalensis]MBL7500109.1 hypothetical protein [Frankia nepalensis]MBL7512434.1 hypothetical protein [Frankia nepalensis]MBL7518804.1 hypothetical protein [Frankia nepalensis]MBL7628571.1 hypothetical protein [Frankia nepalensis]
MDGQDLASTPVVALGVGTDGTFRHFVTAAARLGADVVAVDLAEVVDEGDWRLAIPDDGASRLVTARGAVALDPAAGCFARLVDLSAVEPDPRRAARWRGLTSALAAWLDHVPGPVANRPGAWADNGTKPLHEARLARAGFAVPASLTSADPQALRAFAAAGPTVVKALSGVRATARVVSPAEFTAAAGFTPACGPVHLQRQVDGVDLRVHVCGDVVYAQRITARPDAVAARAADARPLVDYRELDAVGLDFAAVDLPDDLTRRLVATTAESGLLFAGWDLKAEEGAGGTYWVLEANPMPGYDWYDRRAGGAISAALLGALTTARVREAVRA